MKKYETKPRKILRAFLESHPDEHYSVEDIARLLPAEAPISTSSIYRNINDLVDEGLVSRSCAQGSRQLVYRFIGNEQCAQHIHLKCNQCGQLFHVEDDAVNQILASIQEKNGFSVDVKAAVLQGVCKNCE